MNNTNRIGFLHTKRFKDLIFFCAILFIPTLNFVVFTLLVNVQGLMMAFQTKNLDGNLVFTFSNFTRLAKEFTNPNSIIIECTKNTFAVFLTSNFVAMPLAVVFAYFMLKKVPFAGFFKMMFYLPGMISQVAFCYVFSYFISTDGPLSVLWPMLFGNRIPVFLGNNLAMDTILIFNIWSGLGFTIVAISSNMARLPVELFEAAHLDGAGFFTEFWHIVIPLIWPTLSTMIVFNLAGMFSYMGPIMLLTDGNFKTQTFGFFIFKKVAAGDKNQMFYPAAIGWAFTAVATPVILALRTLFKKFWNDATY